MYHFLTTKWIVILSLCIFLLCPSVYSQNNYAYDASGRIVSDLNEGIKTIRWNNQGKITEIIRADTSHQPDLEFKYDSFGRRIEKIVKPRTGSGVSAEYSWEAYYYVYDLSGTLLAMYQKTYQQQSQEVIEETIVLSENELLSTPGILKQNKVTEHILFTTELDPTGKFIKKKYISPAPPEAPQITSIEMQALKGNKQYALVDHAGNIKSVVSDRKLANNQSIKNYTAEVHAADDYYPFGMPMPNRQAINSTFRLGYNGMEKDNEIKGNGNSYNFRARIYDSRLGKWLSIDPLASRFPAESPYSFGFNNPIRFTDPTGMSPEDEVMIIDDSYGLVVTPSAAFKAQMKKRQQEPLPEKEPVYFIDWLMEDLRPVADVEGIVNLGIRAKAATKLWGLFGVNADVNAGNVELASVKKDFAGDQNNVHVFDPENFTYDMSTKVEVQTPIDSKNQKMGIAGIVEQQFVYDANDPEWFQTNSDTQWQFSVLGIGEKKLDKRTRSTKRLKDVTPGERATTKSNSGEKSEDTDFIGIELYFGVQLFLGVEGSIRLGWEQDR